MKLTNEKIMQAANILCQAGRKGNGNWLVVSPEYGKQLMDILEEEERKEKLRQRILKIQKIRNDTEKS